MLPEDIIKSIKYYTMSNSEEKELLKICNEIKEMPLNVGNHQLIRSALVLCDFNSIQLKQLVKSNFKGDPRDVLLYANNKRPSLNYGIDEFDI